MPVIAPGQLGGFGPASQGPTPPGVTAPPHSPPAQVKASPQPYSHTSPSWVHGAFCAGADSGQTGLHGPGASAPASRLASEPPPSALALADLPAQPAAHARSEEHTSELQ